MAVLARDRIGFSDIIYQKEGLHTCIVCCEERQLRELPCGHIECLDCIALQISEARSKGVNFSCQICKRKYAGHSAASFPVAEAALATNQAVYARRDRDTTTDVYGDDHIYEDVVGDYERDVKDVFSRHGQRVEKMEDTEEKKKAEEHMEVTWDEVARVLKKLWQWVKRAFKWIAERLKTFGKWFKAIFL